MRQLGFGELQIEGANLNHALCRVRFEKHGCIRTGQERYISPSGLDERYFDAEEYQELLKQTAVREKVRE